MGQNGPAFSDSGATVLLRPARKFVKTVRFATRLSRILNRALLQYSLPPSRAVVLLYRPAVTRIYACSYINKYICIGFHFLIFMFYFLRYLAIFGERTADTFRSGRRQRFSGLPFST